MPNYMTELSPDNNAHVYQIKDKEAAPITLLKDTVGWVGKNKAPVHIDNIKSLNSSVGTWSGNVYTRNDLTFTFDVNKDGYVTRITLSGTASANTTVELLTLTGAQIKALGSSLVLSGGITSNAYLILRKSDWTNVARSNGSDSNAFNTASLEDATTYYLSAPVTSGTNTSGFVYYPMLRDASIPDSTFEPYHPSVEEEIKQVYVDNGILGAHQWLDVSKDPISYHTTLSVSGHSIRLQTTSQTWGNVSYKLTTLPKNTKFNLRCNASITSGAALIALRGKVAGGSDVVIREISVSAGAFDAEFNTSNYDEITIGFYCTDSTTTTADITYGDILLKLASDMSNDVTDYSETNQQLTQSKFPRSEQRVLGAKNWFDTSKITTTTKITISNEGKNIALENTDSSQYFSRFFYVDVEPNVDYRVSSDIVITSGQAGFKIASEDGTTTIKEEAPFNSSTSKEFTFNPGNRTRIRIILFGTYDVNSACNLSYNNLLVTLATDTDRTWVPYAMTNREMTAIAQPNDGVLQVGKLVVLHKAFTTNDALSGGAWNNNRTDIVFPAPIKNIPVRAFVSGSGFADLMLGESGNNLFSATAINADKTIYITCAYISK